MLKKLHIKGFKSIYDAKLEFGKLNLFIGANGAGKSNVLEAIGMLSSCLGRDITENELQRKGVRLSAPTLFKSAFKNKNLRKTFELDADFDFDVKYKVCITAGENNNYLRFFSEKISKYGIKYIGRSNNGFSVEGIDILSKEDTDKSRGMWDRFREIAKVPPELNRELNHIREFRIYAPQTSFLRGLDIENISLKPLGLQGGGLAQAAWDVILQYTAKKSNSDLQNLAFKILDLVWMPGWAEQIEVKNAQPDIVSSLVKTGEQTLHFKDKFMHGTRNILSAYDSSEGSLYLLFFAVLSLHPEAPKIFALDNIDNSLNPLVTRKLLETILDLTTNASYRSHNIGPTQVFLTSHNPTSLDAFDIFNDDQKIFVVHREPKTGFTAIEQLKPSANMTREEWINIKKGKNLSELWISGFIPNALGTL